MYGTVEARLKYCCMCVPAEMKLQILMMLFPRPAPRDNGSISFLRVDRGEKTEESKQISFVLRPNLTWNGNCNSLHTVSTVPHLCPKVYESVTINLNTRKFVWSKKKYYY